VLDGLGVKKASLLGISQGAWVALKFATTHTERVEKLVLLATAGIERARLSFMLRRSRWRSWGKGEGRR
jgi:pimeloyl-ACP methyl ester carboxylesterase